MPYRPKMTLLSPEAEKSVIQQALAILENVGVLFEGGSAISLLKEEGLELRADGRISLPPDLVQKSLKTAPKSVSLYDRDGQLTCVVGDDQVNFDPGSSALYILDPTTQEARLPVTDDYVRYAQVTSQLDHIAVQSTAFVCSDVPQNEGDWYRLYLSLKHCHKPVVTGTFRKESFEKMKELLVVVRGSEEELVEKPLAIFDACPSPPLKWSDLTSQSLVDAAKAGIPSELVAMPMLGASAPASIFGAVVQHTAENMAGVVLTQLAKPVSPVIWGGAPTSFDMRSGTSPMAAVEAMMVECAYTQVGKCLNLPTHGYMALSDAKTLDAQAGLESGIGGVLAGLVGTNMVSGPGMLDNVAVFSTEKLVVDNEICGMVQRFLRGVEEYPEFSTEEILANYTGQLLSHPSTRKLYRKEFYFPSPVIDRNTRDVWQRTGKSLGERATDLVGKLVKKEEPIPLDSFRKEELDQLKKHFSNSSSITNP